MQILVIAEPPARAELLAAIAARACPRATVRRAAPGEPPAAAVSRVRPELVLLGGGTTERESLPELVAALGRTHPDLPVVVAAERDRAAAAVACMKAGAADYVVVGDGVQLAATLTALAAKNDGPRMRAAAPDAPPDPLAGLVGTSPAMQDLRTLVHTGAGTDAHVLLEGETGTGKEVVARALHQLGRRAPGPFVPINCAAVPETLAESEFFGHARGAFTGATAERPGALQLADHGTLFLDEIEDLPLGLQAKLLRVVQDRQVRPLGASTARRVDVRIVAASNRALWRMVEAGAFRQDLYYRLRVLTIALPPLRQRRGDLPLLIAHFVARFNDAQGTALDPPSAAALRPLLEHAWPGNVRELENTLESLCILARASGGTLDELLRRQNGPAVGPWLDERGRILRVLEDHRWNRRRAAHALGISRVTLWRRMERHGIRDPLGEDAQPSRAPRASPIAAATS
jgi:DNA-binding NtrC family response regulator